MSVGMVVAMPSPKKPLAMTIVYNTSKNRRHRAAAMEAAVEEHQRNR